LKSSNKGHFAKENFKRAKVGKMCWELIILNCTIKTRMIYFGVANRYKAQNWRIFESKTRTTIFRVQGKREEGVAGASQRRQIKLHTSCDVPATLNQLKTTVVDGARSIFAATVVSCPDQKYFPKMLPGRS
jgi:hypothetical protein